MTSKWYLHYSAYLQLAALYVKVTEKSVVSNFQLHITDNPDEREEHEAMVNTSTKSVVYANVNIKQK